jgi:hypothetical protein
MFVLTYRQRTNPGHQHVVDLLFRHERSNSCPSSYPAERLNAMLHKHERGRSRRTWGAFHKSALYFSSGPLRFSEGRGTIDPFRD